MKSHGLFVSNRFPIFLFLSYRSIFFPLPYGNLHMAHHGWRPWITIFCWFWTDSFWLEKYFSDHLFQVNIWKIIYMLYCACVCAQSLQSCPTLCDLLDCNPPGSSVHGILQARILHWVAFPPSGDLPDPGIEPVSLISPSLVGRVLYH